MDDRSELVLSLTRRTYFLKGS